MEDTDITKTCILTNTDIFYVFFIVRVCVSFWNSHYVLIMVCDHGAIMRVIVGVCSCV